MIQATPEKMPPEEAMQGIWSRAMWRRPRPVQLPIMPSFLRSAKVLGLAFVVIVLL